MDIYFSSGHEARITKMFEPICHCHFVVWIFLTLLLPFGSMVMMLLQLTVQDEQLLAINFVSGLEFKARENAFVSVCV